MIRSTEHSVPGSPFRMPRIAQLFHSPVGQPERDKPRTLRRHGPPLHVYKRGAACGVLVARESLASPCTKVCPLNDIPGPQTLADSFTEESSVCRELYEALLGIGRGGSGCK